MNELPGAEFLRAVSRIATHSDESEQLRQARRKSPEAYGGSTLLGRTEALSPQLLTRQGCAQSSEIAEHTQFIGDDAR